MTTTYMAQSGTRVGRQRERISMPKTAPFLEENLKRGTVHYSIAALPNSNMNHKCNFEFPSSHMGKVKKKKKKGKINTFNPNTYQISFQHVINTKNY